MENDLISLGKWAGDFSPQLEESAQGSRLLYFFYLWLLGGIFSSSSTFVFLSVQ